MRLLVVSHAAALAANQAVYAALASEDVDVQLVVPRSWRNEYRTDPFGAEVDPRLHGRVHLVPVVGRGRPQRHAHLALASRVIRRFAPEVLFVEEEPFSLATLVWARAAIRARLAFGVQLAETLDRPLPAPVRTWRRFVLERADFVAARSPGAARLAASWGTTGEVAVVAHSVDDAAARPIPTGPLVVAFVGRLVPEKGIADLVGAVGSLAGRLSLLVAGDGPLRGLVQNTHGVTWLGGVRHDDVGAVYERAHVTCVPSRTTPRWEEQFGRVAVESLARAVPVVATSTGELPWVLETTGGGVLVPEGDRTALGGALLHVGQDRTLGAVGRDGVRRAFSHQASASALAAVLRGVSP